MSNARALRHAIHLVETSSQFDATWYRQRYGDAELMAMGAAEHFVRIGARLLRDPGPGFCTEFYLASNQDVARSHLNPFVHFLSHGLREGRQPISRRAPIPAAASAPAKREESAKAPAGARALSPQQSALLRDAFDAEFYRAQCELAAGVDPFDHFMQDGWRKGHDPCAAFSTSHYLRRYPDIARAGINPFAHYVLHGRGEKREALPRKNTETAQPYLPKVSVVVPNFNHGRFLAERIDSILGQSYSNLELLVLDDCSSDDSRDVIADYCRRHPDKIRCLFNESNSGNVFRQWRKGVESVDGDLVWICESDDFCDAEFLSKLVPAFRDRSVNLAFGRIQFVDHEGSFREGLDRYRELAEPGIWKNTLVRPASEWFAGAFGVNNVIANVGGCLMRRQSLPDATWQDAEKYGVLGDWFLYVHLAGGGQICFEPEAVAYFRQHGSNTSVTSFHSPAYYAEHQRLMTVLKQRWHIPDATLDRFLGNIEHQYTHFKVAERHGPLSLHVDRNALLGQARTVPHILIGFLGFYPGGGEFFPLHLARTLRAQGCVVSMLACQDESENETMVSERDPGVPVYRADHILPMAAGDFLRRAGVSVVHSHMVCVEGVLLESPESGTSGPYLVTLHGSYEACEIESERVARFAARISQFVYTARRNLEPFRQLGAPGPRFSKMPNGMLADPRPFPQGREELGIDPSAVVFTLVARGILRKGWRSAIAAFIQLRHRRPERKMHLLLCGEGELVDRLREVYGHDPDITFLGFQSCISGLYRLSDCAIAPTRFAGESFPLCLIQAMQVGTPVVSSDVGDIREMVLEAPTPAGIVIEAVRDTQEFAASLSVAMEQMLSPVVRQVCSQGAAEVGQRYRLEAVATKYRAIYQRLLEAVDEPVAAAP